MLLNENDILQRISHIDICKDIDKYLEGEKTLPLHYCKDELNIEAVVLGCDPSSNKGYDFKRVFGLDEEDMKNYSCNFFNDIEINLNAIDLNKSNVYVQNLCRNYFLQETSNYFNNKKSSELYCDNGLIYKKSNFNENEWKQKVQSEYVNNKWIRVASEWVNLLNQELDRIDKDKRLPVLITSQYLLLPLIKDGYENVVESAGFYYSNVNFRTSGYITKEKNKLQRTIIPLFRSDTYFLDEDYLESRIKNNKNRRFLPKLPHFKKRNNEYKNHLKRFIKDGVIL